MRTTGGDVAFIDDVESEVLLYGTLLATDVSRNASARATAVAQALHAARRAR